MELRNFIGYMEKNQQYREIIEGVEGRREGRKEWREGGKGGKEGRRERGRERGKEGEKEGGKIRTLGLRAEDPKHR